jgi:glucokinase
VNKTVQINNIPLGVRLVGDIGGTNARFAYVEQGAKILNRIKIFPCANFPHFIDAIRHYIKLCELSNIAGVCFAVAGPIEHDLIDLPNNHWKFSRSDLQAQLGVPVSIINDFSAQVLCIGDLGDADLMWLGDARPNPLPAVKAVLGPGTGLGVSAIMPSGDVVPSEGGHVGFAPQSPHEIELLKQLWTRYERVSVERLLSGMGLANLYWANCRLAGLERELDAPGVTAGARMGDEFCRRAVTDFCSILGSVAGDLALSMGSAGGVYISGGIVPGMLDLFDPDTFRMRFNDKGRFKRICEDTSVAIILAGYPGLLGCVNALKKSG